MIDRFHLLRLLVVLLTTFNLLYSDELLDTQNLESIHSNVDSTSQQTTKYLTGDIDLLSRDALDSVKNVSNELYNKTKFALYVHIVKKPFVESTDVALDRHEKFQLRRDYEQQWVSQLQGQYAVLFLFYDDHAITIKTNVDFLKTQDLLDDYAYPYLPAESVGTEKYRDGVNEGLSNLYLAVANAVATHYNVQLQIPKPMEKPSDVTKIVIYVMLFIMIGLFVLVSSGFFAKKKKD